MLSVRLNGLKTQGFVVHLLRNTTRYCSRTYFILRRFLHWWAETEDTVRIEDGGGWGYWRRRSCLVCTGESQLRDYGCVHWDIKDPEAGVVMVKQSCNTAFSSLWLGWHRALHTSDTGEFWFMNAFKWVHNDLNSCLKSMPKLKSFEWWFMHGVVLKECQRDCVCRWDWRWFVFKVICLLLIQ